MPNLAMTFWCLELPPAWADPVGLGWGGYLGRIEWGERVILSSVGSGVVPHLRPGVEQKPRGRENVSSVFSAHKGGCLVPSSLVLFLWTLGPTLTYASYLTLGPFPSALC